MEVRVAAFGMAFNAETLQDSPVLALPADVVPYPPPLITLRLEGPKLIFWNEDDQCEFGSTETAGDDVLTTFAGARSASKETPFHWLFVILVDHPSHFTVTYEMEQYGSDAPALRTFSGTQRGWPEDTKDQVDN